MSQTRSLSGTYLGKYKVEHRLGRGGMAEVYKAYQANLERYVAIKVMHAFLADDGDFLQRFQREAQAMAATRHPHIAGVYDFEAEGEYYYIVMEYLPGGSLKDRIDDAAEAGQLIPLDLAVRVVVQIAEALAFAHSVGMIHRDIKPANIMFNEHDSAVLTDFGIAKLLSGPSHTATGSMIGTPAYMSPEQGLGEPGDERSDIYALGVLFYHLVTGNLPHDGDTPLSVVLKHVNDAPERPTVLNPDLPQSVERVIMQAMAKDPDMRYQRAGDMARELRQISQQESLGGEYGAGLTSGRGNVFAAPPSASVSSAGVIPENEFDFYNNLVTPVPPLPKSGSALDNFDDSGSIEFFVPPDADEPNQDVTSEIHSDLLYSSATGEEDPSLSTQISARDSLPTQSDNDFYTQPPVANHTAISKPEAGNDMTQVGAAPADLNMTQIGAVAVDPQATAVTGALSTEQVTPAQKGFDVSALTSALAGLSEFTEEPGTGNETHKVNKKQNDKRRKQRSRRLRRVMRQGLRIFFILAGLLLGYGVWQGYLADADKDGTVDQFNAWLNEQSGGQTADDVELAGIVAEEKPRQYLLQDIEGPVMVLNLDSSLESVVTWNTIVQRRALDGNWEDLGRWTVLINRDDQAVWPLDDDDLQSGEMYRWVIVDTAEDASIDPVAQSAPFFFNGVEDWPLEITAMPVVVEE